MRDINAESSNTYLFCTILGFAAISWLLWKFFLSTPVQTGASSSTTVATDATTTGNVGSSSTRAGTDTSTSSSSTTRTMHAPGTNPSSSSGRSRTAASSSSTAPTSKKDAIDDLFSFGHPRHPPHLIAPENWEQNKSDLSGIILQGIVPFRSIPASGYESRLKKMKESMVGDDDGKSTSSSAADLIVVNRRERARIFARMFSVSEGGGRPPNRGVNIVVTIRHTEISCSRLQKALFLLGTYYNIFLLVEGSGVAAASGKDVEVKEFVKKMRSELLNQGIGGSAADSGEYKLNSEIIPPHRIAFSSTAKGRVAFVRQLHGTELVVDFDENVTKELERFGFRVLVYPKGGETSSALGSFLIP